MRDDFLTACNRHETLRPVLPTSRCSTHRPAPISAAPSSSPPRSAATASRTTSWWTRCWPRSRANAARCRCWPSRLPGCGSSATARRGLLTREAYQDIGGVGGALAQHAEATIDRIGVERIPIVRELFRNLVTAEGTRAVREWNELLSIFEKSNIKREGINPSPTMLSASLKTVGEGFIPSRSAAEEVLRELIDARLLTSYEIHEDEQEPTRRVEIIHESLLANWPRLVRWQTQDQEGAQLRDELRQAARAWDEHGRHDDRLWTGTAFREYQLWRERYPGGLTELEEAFATAMTSLAGRRRRRRRMIVTAVMAALIAGLAIVGSFWQRSVRETRRAEAEANRAEAAKLLALGQVVLESYPTAALAWTTSSLELADTREGRLLALRALQKAPPVMVLPMQPERVVVRPSEVQPQWSTSGDLRGNRHARVVAG